MRPLIRTPYWLLLLLCLAIDISMSAPAPVIVVLYPQTISPYRAVFEEILSGIAQRLDTAELRRYALNEEDDPDNLRRWLDDQRPRVVITLGRRAAHAFDAAGTLIPRVIGALDVSPQTRPEATGVSLSIEPSLLFETLRLLIPDIKTVYVVYDPNRDQWIIDLAQQTAVHYDLTLHSFKAPDLRTSAQKIWQVLQTANPDIDALWLPMDSRIIDDHAVLPLIIEQSWNRRLPVFSSNLMHVDRGVLFALYPDNEALGRRLAELALRFAEGLKEPSGIEPLRDVKRALNLRISHHLGLSIDQQVERQFDLVFRPR